MFSFDKMKSALTSDTGVMFSNTEIDLMKITEKNVNKIGVKQHQRVVLYFTPALSVVANSIVHNFKVKDNDLIERLRWVVGHTVKYAVGSEPVPEGKLPLDPHQNALSTTSWLSRLDGIQFKTPNLLLSLTRSIRRSVFAPWKNRKISLDI